MARLPLVLAALLLAGCSSPGPSIDEPRADANVPAPYTETQEFDGDLLGVGVMEPVTNRALFAGQFTTFHEMTVRENATAVRFTVTWDRPAQAIYVFVGPAGSDEQTAFTATPEEMLAQELRFDYPANPEVLDFLVRTNGAAAGLAFHIVVEVDYAAA